jgi:hypothetical protein
MSLADAGALLDLAPNSVRSRFKAGKLRGERDNEGKLWVWLDPEEHGASKASIEPTSKPSSDLSNPSNDDTSKPSKRVSKASIEPSNSNEIEALKGHIETLSEQLAGANAELSILRPKASLADRLEAEIAGLKAQAEALSSDRDEWRKTAQGLIQRRRGWFGRR